MTFCGVSPDPLLQNTNTRINRVLEYIQIQYNNNNNNDILEFMVPSTTLIGTGEWQRRSNEQIKQLCGKSTVVQFLKGARLKWAGHVKRADNGIVQTILVNDSNG